MSQSPVQRLQRRISARLAEEKHKPRAARKTRSGLAKAVGIRKSSLTESLKESANQGLLARLDLIADYLGMTPAELVQKESSRLMELSAPERRIIRQWRAWPEEIRGIVVKMVDYFADLLPEEQSARELIYYWRRLPTAEDRDDLIRGARDAALMPRPRPPRATTGTVVEKDRKTGNPSRA